MIQSIRSLPPCSPLLTIPLARSCSYHIVLNVTAMGYEEGQTIFGIDEEITAALNLAKNRAYFVYSPIDRYTPQSIIDDTTSRFPQASITMTEATVPHAFVISHTHVVANIAIAKLLESSYPQLIISESKPATVM